MYKSKKRIIIISMALLFLLGINISCNNTIVDPDVVKIIIEDRETGLVQSIIDKDSLNRIVATVNSCKKEFCIFYPKKEMILKYKRKKDISILINSNGHYLKIDGKAYVSSRGLE